MRSGFASHLPSCHDQSPIHPLPTLPSLPPTPYSDPKNESLTFLDATPGYILLPTAACRIRAAFPDAKIIAILRDPVKVKEPQLLSLHTSEASVIPVDPVLLQTYMVSSILPPPLAEGSVPLEYACMGEGAEEAL